MQRETNENPAKLEDMHPIYLAERWINKIIITVPAYQYPLEYSTLDNGTTLAEWLKSNINCCYVIKFRKYSEIYRKNSNKWTIGNERGKVRRERSLARHWEKEGDRKIEKKGKEREGRGGDCQRAVIGKRRRFPLCAIFYSFCVCVLMPTCFYCQFFNIIWCIWSIDRRKSKSERWEEGEREKARNKEIEREEDTWKAEGSERKPQLTRLIKKYLNKNNTNSIHLRPEYEQLLLYCTRQLKWQQWSWINLLLWITHIWQKLTSVEHWT